MTKQQRQATTWSVVLLLARVVAGGALLLAGALKLNAGVNGPRLFAMTIDSFRIAPGFTHLPLAYYLPWFEITIGLAIVLGCWSRQAAGLAACLYMAFTLALASVLLRGMSISCGCFGDLFGDPDISWFSIARNTVFLVPTLLLVWKGGGRFAVHRDEPRTHEPVVAGTENARQLKDAAIPES